MPVQSIQINELPKATRNRVSPIKLTKDWRETLERIKAGDFEALRVEFASETLDLGKATPDRFKRLLTAELRRLGRYHGMDLYRGTKLTFRGKSATGAPILYVIRRDHMTAGSSKSGEAPEINALPKEPHSSRKRPKRRA
jgi:hypothetical protein